MVTVESESLAEESTSPPIETEVASISRDQTVVMFGGNILLNADPLLASKGAGRGLRLYDDLLRDTHVKAVFEKLRLAVTSREWRVDAASESPADQEVAELVREQLKSINLDRVCTRLLSAVLKGVAVVELMWSVGKSEITLKEFKGRGAHRFVFDRETRLRLLTQQSPLEGELMPERKFVVFSWGSDEEHPYGLGLGSVLFWPVFFKRKGISFWLSFAERFGSPTVIGEYPRGTVGEERKIFEKALKAVAQEGAISIPSGMVIRLLEAQRSGNINTYESLCRYMDEQISEAVLGETLTTNMGQGGAYALGKIHNDVRIELAKAIADQLHDQLNETLVKWIVEFNRPGARPPKVWRVFPELANLDQQSQRDERLVKMGFRPSAQYIRDTYGGDWREANATAGPAFAEASDATDAYTEQAGRLAQGAMQPLIDPIRTLLGEVSSLEELRDRLLESYGEMNPQDMRALLGAAMSASNLAGRYEVTHGR